MIYYIINDLKIILKTANWNPQFNMKHKSKIKYAFKTNIINK